MNKISPLRMRAATALVIAAVLCVWISLSVVWLVVAAHRRGHETQLSEDDYVAPSLSPSIAPSSSTLAPCPTPLQRQSTPPRQCHLAQAQAAGVADDAGRACLREQVVAETNCCPPWTPQFECGECSGGCCAEYHVCVSCCMGKDVAFHKCSSQCRTSSKSLNRQGEYRDERRHFCWSRSRPPERPVAEKQQASVAPIKWLKLTPT